MKIRYFLPPITYSLQILIIPPSEDPTVTDFHSPPRRSRRSRPVTRATNHRVISQTVSPPKESAHAPVVNQRPASDRTTGNAPLLRPRPLIVNHRVSKIDRLHASGRKISRPSKPVKTPSKMFKGITSAPAQGQSHPPVRQRLNTGEPALVHLPRKSDPSRRLIGKISSPKASAHRT